MNIKIVSGGQTGVDQGVLEAAARLGWSSADGRESKSPGIQAKTKAFLSEVLRRAGRDDGII